MPFALAVDGTRLYYELSGAGEPLRLIAGRGADHCLWNMVRPGLARHFLVIGYDHRGTGQSDKPAQPPYSTRGFAKDAVSILNHLKISRAHVYGASLGGAVAQWMAIEYSERVGGLVLAGTWAGGAHRVVPSPEVRAIMDGNDPKRVMDILFAHQWTRTRFYRSVGQPGDSPVPPYVDRLHARASEDHDAWDRLPFIRAPTLVLQGGDDPVVPSGNARLLVERIPGAEMCVIPRGRHAFFLEFRSRVNRRVRRFLRDHSFSR
jgi:pimeloyl-ACP methyl ester carboxylesterase